MKKLILLLAIASCIQSPARDIQATWDQRRTAAQQYQPLTFYAAEDLTYTHTATTGTNSYDLGANGVVWQVLGWGSEVTNQYWASTGTVTDASGGEVEFTLPPQQTNLDPGLYQGFVIELSGTNIYRVLSSQKIIVQASPQSAFYAAVQPNPIVVYSTTNHITLASITLTNTLSVLTPDATSEFFTRALSGSAAVIPTNSKVSLRDASVSMRLGENTGSSIFSTYWSGTTGLPRGNVGTSDPYPPDGGNYIGVLQAEFVPDSIGRTNEIIYVATSANLPGNVIPESIYGLVLTNSSDATFDGTRRIIATGQAPDDDDPVPGISTGHYWYALNDPGGADASSVTGVCKQAVAILSAENTAISGFWATLSGYIYGSTGGGPLDLYVNGQTDATNMTMTATASWPVWDGSSAFDFHSTYGPIGRKRYLWITASGRFEHFVFQYTAYMENAYAGSITFLPADAP